MPIDPRESRVIFSPARVSVIVSVGLCRVCVSLIEFVVVCLVHSDECYVQHWRSVCSRGTSDWSPEWAFASREHRVFLRELCFVSLPREAFAELIDRDHRPPTKHWLRALARLSSLSTSKMRERESLSEKQCSAVVRLVKKSRSILFYIQKEEEEEENNEQR